MHYSTYIIYPDMSITKDNKSEIHDWVVKRFNNGYCYECGEGVPAIEPYCDWFTIGGRWMNAFKVKAGKGVKGSWSYFIDKEEEKQHKKLQAIKTRCDIVNIKDIVDLKKLIEPYAVVINGQNVVTRETWNEKKQSFEINPEFTKLFNDLKSGKYKKGIIANIDCHN